MALAQDAAQPLAGSSSGSNTGPGAGAGAGAGAPAGAGLGSGSDSSSDSGADSGGPPTPPPVADTVLPRVGIDDNLPDLRDHLLDAFGTPATPERAGQLPQSGLQITKQIGVSEEFTDNAGRFAGGGGSGYDFITLIQPQVTITDATQRIQLNLNYAPTGEIYARNTGYSQFEAGCERRRAGDRAAELAVRRSAWLDQSAIRLRRLRAEHDGHTGAR